MEADDERRRRTLLALIDLASTSSPGDCWDDQRAVDLLRSQSAPDELRALGASEAVIGHVFGERDER